MSFAEIEAELDRLTPDELRRLALKSWRAFVAKESDSDTADECSEDDLRLLESLDTAITQADATLGQGHSGEEVRVQLAKWTSR
jgi:hypothetical protein